MFGISDISKVCYYPAAGTDIQAILRFSHLTDTILAPTASKFLTREVQKELFVAKCDALNAFYGKPLLELVDVVDLDHHFEGEPRFIRGGEDIFTTEEQIAYVKAFMPLVPIRLSATRFVFKRRIGHSERTINWIHTTTEGLATLAIIYLRTGIVPEIFCTIQTGSMEYPWSILIRMFERMGRYPRIWVRGFWPTKVWGRTPIQPFPPYGAVAQDYGYWNSSFGITTLSHEDNSSKQQPSRLSYVRAFTREPLELPVKTHAICSSRNPERRVTIEYGSITDHFGRFDGSIVSEHLGTSELGVNFSNVMTWELLSERNASGFFPVMSLFEGLVAAEAYAQKQGLKRIAITPMGYEDEGESVSQYLDASDAAVDITVFALRPLDFIGLTSPE